MFIQMNNYHVQLNKPMKLFHIVTVYAYPCYSLSSYYVLSLYFISYSHFQKYPHPPLNLLSFMRFARPKQKGELNMVV